MTVFAEDPRRTAQRWRLRLEFAAFFVAAPVLGAVVLPADAMFTMLFALTALGLGLLHLTPGFRWTELATGWDRIGWGRVALVALATGLTGLAVLGLTAPQALFALPRHRPELMLTIALLYPVLSALPQEIVYRVLFFRRYGTLLPGGAAALWINAAVFALAHLMYWSVLVLAMTLAGGLVFAEAYARRNSFATAVTAHAVAGVVLFAVGLGLYFYSGNVTRPF